VADKTVDIGRDVVDKSKPVVKKVGDKSVDVGTTVVDATKSGAKKTGKAIKKVINP
jgi:isocitrate/isopropylmalate dehydrogenase